MNVRKLNRILLVSTQRPLWFYIMYNRNLMFHSGLNIDISTRTATGSKQWSRLSSLKLTRCTRPTTVMVRNYAEGVNVLVTVFALKV